MGNGLNTSNLTVLDTLPEGITEVKATELHKILPTPTLVHLTGRTENPMFVSVLQHGNEETGLLAIQALLRKYQSKQLPRSLSIFFGNIDAAKQGSRKLDGQPDYNRVWPGTEQPPTKESSNAQQIVNEMKEREVFISLDVHNNTGINPHYACINTLDTAFLHLANLFGRFVVYFIRPKGVQSAAFAELCPAVTLECGKPGVQYGVEHAFEYLDSCLHLSQIPDHPVAPQDIDLFHTVSQVCIPDHVSFSFQENTADLMLSNDLERMNFTEIRVGTEFGHVNLPDILPVVATNEHGNEITADYFTVTEGRLVCCKPVMPSMLTLNEDVIRQDCLCYLMERIKLPS